MKEMLPTIALITIAALLLVIIIASGPGEDPRMTRDMPAQSLAGVQAIQEVQVSESPVPVDTAIADDGVTPEPAVDVPQVAKDALRALDEHIASSTEIE